MRSISFMPCNEWAGVAKRRVPLPNGNALQRMGRCREAPRAVTQWECLATNGQVSQSVACQYPMGMLCDDLAGDAKRRVPLPYVS